MAKIIKNSSSAKEYFEKGQKNVKKLDER